MEIKKLMSQLNGKLTDNEFYRLTGIDRAAVWKIQNTDYACPSGKVLLIYDLAKENGTDLSEKDVLSLLLGVKFAHTLKDLDELLSGIMDLETWVNIVTPENNTQISRLRILGMDYSELSRLRSGEKKRFRSKRAVAMVRLSNYEIDIFGLLGTSKEFFNKERKTA